jgi:hypothetical protein
MMPLVPVQSPHGERWFMTREDSERAFAIYSRDHKNQTHDRLIARGGFGCNYMDSVAPGWVPRAFDGQPIEEIRRNPCYFHGRWPGGSGHSTHMKDGGSPTHWDMPPSPWGLPETSYRWLTDSMIYPVMGPTNIYGSKDPREIEGVRHHAQKDGWTLVAWWDRSGDPRRGSVAAFAMSGTLTGDEAEARARADFPAVWARIDTHLRKVQS